MDRLIRHARKLLEYEEPLVLAGDFNVIPEAADAARPELWTGDALFLPQTREKFRELLSLGFTDALRATTDAGGLYTFWDYQAGAWQKNNGIRIDHLLLSPQAADRLVSVEIDKAMRGRTRRPTTRRSGSSLPSEEELAMPREIPPPHPGVEPRDAA